jgi:hypothetical protein
MTPEQVQYIRDRLADWEAVPDAIGDYVPMIGGVPQPVPIKISTLDGRELWSTEDLTRTARHLRILVDACEASLSRPEGSADYGWAITILGSLALIWSDRPDYPKASSDD